MTISKTSREWCWGLHLFLMCAEPAKVWVLLVKTQSPEAETGQRDHTFFNLIKYIVKYYPPLGQSWRLSERSWIWHSSFSGLGTSNSGIWFAVYSFVPLEVTRKLSQQVEFPDFFLISPGEKPYGRKDPPWPHLESKGRYFILLLVHSTNFYEVCTLFQAPF